MGIYPPANDVCQDAAFLFKDRPELIRWVYGEAWETSSLKVSVDHGSPALRAAVRKDTPSKLPVQLSIWIFITHESDVYKKVVFRCEKSPPILRFAIRSIPVASRAKTCVKRRFFARFRLRLNGY